MPDSTLKKFVYKGSLWIFIGLINLSGLWAQTITLTKTNTRNDFNQLNGAILMSATESLPPGIASFLDGKTENILVINDSENTLSLPVVYSTDDSLYADINLDGQIQDTEHISRQNDVLGTFGRVKISKSFPYRSTVDVYTSLTDSNMSMYFQYGMFVRNPESYTGRWESDNKSVLIGLYLSPDQWEYTVSPEMFVYVDENGDQQFSREERHASDLPFLLGENIVEVDTIQLANNNAVVTLRSSSQRIAPVKSFIYPTSKVTKLNTYTTVAFPGQNNTPTVINYWAVSCMPCRIEIPKLNALVSEYPEVTFLAVNPLEPQAIIEPFLGNIHFDYSQVLMERSIAKKVYRINIYPTHVILDPAGQVVYQSSGYRESLVDTLRVILDTLK